MGQGPEGAIKCGAQEGSQMWDLYLQHHLVWYFMNWKQLRGAAGCGSCTLPSPRGETTRKGREERLTQERRPCDLLPQGTCRCLAPVGHSTPCACPNESWLRMCPAEHRQPISTSTGPHSCSRQQASEMSRSGGRQGACHPPATADSSALTPSTPLPVTSARHSKPARQRVRSLIHILL